MGTQELMRELAKSYGKDRPFKDSELFDKITALTYPEIGKKFAQDWVKMGFNPAGLTEGFRGFDGITTIVAGIKAAGKPDAEAIRAGLWTIKAQGLNGDIAFVKQGPAGKESAQNSPNVYVVKIDGGKVVKN